MQSSTVTPKKIALVGHCGPDSSYLRMAVGNAIKGAKVLMIDDDEDLTRAVNDGVDLLLFNRVLEFGFSADLGVDLIKRFRQAHPDLKMMLVSNYADAQTAAVAAGALPGFGKREIGTPKVTDMLRRSLENS